ncbi:unnamed protein product [Haemonchus placei]|uniref:Secreted protein n=1 Tax=Haemonchus placei TaxID=6290 RepID=A0A0N4WWA9_HAEPC|nr:unnamed protein product [Haemonchus placei]
MLVATNGIAAVRCILSIRKLLMQLFRNDRIIKFICLTTEQEIRSNAGKRPQNRLYHMRHVMIPVLGDLNPLTCASGFLFSDNIQYRTD